MGLYRRWLRPRVVASHSTLSDIRGGLYMDTLQIVAWRFIPRSLVIKRARADSAMCWPSATHVLFSARSQPRGWWRKDWKVKLKMTDRGW